MENRDEFQRENFEGFSVCCFKLEHQLMHEGEKNSTGN